MDPVPLLGVDQRTPGHITGRGATHGQRFGLGDEPVRIVVIDRLVHQMPADDHASLPLVEEAAVRQGVHPVVQVGVGEHDRRVVAAQFEVGAGKVPRRELAVGAAGLGGTGEGHGVDAGVRDHR
jgi:hypothetical protein